MTLTPEQITILRCALVPRWDIPTCDHYSAPRCEVDLCCEGMVTAGLMSRSGNPRVASYRVTGAGVRALFPDAKAAVYLPTGDDVTVFSTPGGRFKMRWDGPGKGRFVQGKVYRVSDAAVKIKEAT